ncbi:MAG: HAMP domain-containing sensor histidine kinase [Eubacteriales bacterium]
MTFYHDKQVKVYLMFIFFCSVLVLVGMIFVSQNHVSVAKSIFLEHDTAVVSALLEQGVSEEIIVNAISNTTISKDGTELLNMIGISEDTTNSLFPFLSQFENHAFRNALIVSTILIVILCTGTFFFLWKRNRLYLQAQNIIECYINGDYTNHLPQNSEGEIYHLFSSIEQLATMLQSKNETEYKTKEFLKNTISDISHQLKTPLAALTMYQEIIETEPDNEVTVKEFSKKIDTALKRIEQLIQSMLKITRLDTGNIVFDKKLYLVHEVVKNAVNELTTRAKNENKQIVIDGDSKQSFMCDKDWTSEAIGNIVKNALDHTTTGGIVRITWENSPNMFRIYIYDNGKGIAQEDIHHIFKRFYRSKHSLDTQGIGLGLPLAKCIVEGQDGLISVYSTIHEGTTFTLSFLTKL